MTGSFDSLQLAPPPDRPACDEIQLDVSDPAAWARLIEPSQVAEASMRALATRANGSQWMVWGDMIKQYEMPDFGLV